MNVGSPDQANQEYKQKLGSEEPMRIDLHEKQTDVIANANIAGTVLHEIEREEQQAKLTRLRSLPKTFSSELDHHKPQDGKLLLTELAKTLWLNAQDPEKYNTEFFARYFNVEPQTLRNVLNVVAYPVVDEERGEVIKLLRFTDLK